MATGELYARIAQMRDAAVTLHKSASRIHEAIQAVDGEVRLLGSDRFASVGADAFRAEYYRLTPRLKESFDLLSAFHDKLSAAADDIEVAARTTQG